MANFSGGKGMKALTITNKAITREALAHMAEEIPGAWIGFRIAAILLVLDGWKSSQIARLFAVSRWSVVKWIRWANEEGLSGLREGQRSGRPSRIDEQIQKALAEALESSPRELGLKRNRWDGIVVVEYLERMHGIKLKVRQAQRWIRRLGFSLRQPMYRYVQATKDGVEESGKTLKKTPSGQKK
jgi:transposase